MRPSNQQFGILQKTELLLLSTFLYPRALHEDPYFPVETWTALLARERGYVLSLLRESRLIRMASREEAFNAVATPRLIQEMAKKMGLPEDMSISDATKMIVERTTNAEFRLLVTADLYICTDAGKALSLEFLQRQQPAVVDDDLNGKEWLKKKVSLIATAFLASATGGIIGNRSDALFVSGVTSLSEDKSTATPAQAHSEQGRDPHSTTSVRDKEGNPNSKAAPYPAPRQVVEPHLITSGALHEKKAHNLMPPLDNSQREISPGIANSTSSSTENKSSGLLEMFSNWLMHFFH